MPNAEADAYWEGYRTAERTRLSRFEATPIG